MRNIFYLFLLIMIDVNLCGLNISIEDIYTSISINDNTMKIEYYDSGVLVCEKYPVQWETINSVNYINFFYDGNFLGEKIVHGRKRYLVLYNGYLIFYNNQNKAEYYLCGFRHEADLSSFTATKTTASSELQENGLVYWAHNMLNKNILLPWVEGMQGDGIGQTINIEFGNPLVLGLNGLYISNGYVDYNKPYLYEYNNRVKKIRISSPDYNKYREFEIKDTPNFQYIHLDMDFLRTSILIEIIEVYKGSRWDDTCINCILPLGF